jgi:hypothetical protein
MAPLLALLLLAASPLGDDAAQLRALKQAAQSGDAEAAYRLGRSYKLGDLAPLDPGEAERWFEKAARLGLVQGEAEYGLTLFQNGRQREAVPWLRKAAERGDRRAQYALGTILFNGTYAPQDMAGARSLMERAAKAGLPAAAEALEVMKQPPAAPPVEIVTIQPPRPPAPAVSAKSPAKGWRVQVGAFSSRANADRLWAQLRPRGSSTLVPLFRYDGRVTRLQVGPFDSAATAEAFCKRVRDTVQDCFRVGPALAERGRGAGRLETGFAQ